LQIILKLFSEILEILLYAFRAVGCHGVGPRCRKFSRRICHDIMHVAGDDHVVYSNLITTYKLKLRLLTQQIFHLFKKFWYVYFLEGFDGVFLAGGGTVPDGVIK